MIPTPTFTSGSGVGSPGGPIQPSIRELESTASVEVAKAAMKLVADTLEIPLMLLDQDVRKYQSASNRPVLAPLISVRVPTSYAPLPDESWRPVYDQLVASLPQGFRELFLLAQQVPLNERNINFVIFDNILQSLAKAVVILSIAAEPVDAESLAALHAQQNLALPYIALNSLVLQGEFLLAEAQAFLSLVGANYVNFDAFNNFTAQLGAIIGDLRTASALLQDETQTDAAFALIASVGARIDTLNAEYSRLSGAGNDLQMIGATLNAMSIVAAALTLENAGSGSLALGLAIASIAANTQASALGIFGPSFIGTADTLAAFLLAAYLPNASLGTQLLLTQLTEIALAGAVIFGALTYADGFGLPPLTGNETPAELALRAFAFTTAIEVLVHSDIASVVFRAIAGGVDAGGDVQEAIKQILKMIALLLMILAGLQSGSPAASAAIMRGLKGIIQEGLNATSNAIGQAQQNGQVTDETAGQLNVFVEQAKIALDNEDFGAFLDALNGAIGVAGATGEDFFKDLQGIRDFAQSISAILTSGADDETNTLTGINVAA